MRDLDKDQRKHLSYINSKACYRDLSAGRWHLALLCDIVAWEGVQRDLPGADRPEGKVFPGGIVVREPIAFSFPEVPIVL